MNIKALLAVIALGAGGTVVVLATNSPPPGTFLPDIKTAAMVAAAPDVPRPNPASGEQSPAEKSVPAVLRNEPSAPVTTKIAAEVSPPPAAPANPTIIWSTPPLSNTAPASDRPPAAQQQLDALVAPIALYPDQVLSQILMASTYALEVVAAARWAARPENQGLQGERLAAALDQQDWDPSVKALAAFPHILKMMDADLEWMGKLGDAFQDRQSEVMDAVQRLRRDAKAADKLNSDARQRVTVQDEQIIIAPANPEVVYVPFYDPQSAYGIWPYPDYPPAYMPPPLGYSGSPGIYYSFVAVRPFWGWSAWDWHNRHIHIVDVPRYTYYNRGRGPIDNDVWRHDPGRGRGDRSRGNDRPRAPAPGPNIPDRIDTPPPINMQVRRPRGPIVPGARNESVDVAQPIEQRRRGAVPPPGALPDVTPQLPDVTPPLPASITVPAIAPPISTPPPEVNRFQDDRRRPRGPVVPEQNSTQDNRQNSAQDEAARRQRRFQDGGMAQPQPAAPPPPSPATAAPPPGANFRQRGYVPPTPNADNDGDGNRCPPRGGCKR